MSNQEYSYHPYLLSLTIAEVQKLIDDTNKRLDFYISICATKNIITLNKSLEELHNLLKEKQRKISAGQ